MKEVKGVKQFESTWYVIYQTASSCCARLCYLFVNKQRF